MGWFRRRRRSANESRLGETERGSSGSELLNATDTAAEPRAGAPAAEPQPAPPPWSLRERNSGEPSAVRIGEPSTFGSADWWSTDWWPLGACEGDVVADFATVSSFAIAGASLRGNKHRLSGDAGEDAFHIRRAATSTGAEFACIAVCDGVGSASRSRDGARWLSRAVTAELAAGIAESDEPERFGEEDARRAVATAVQNVQDHAERRGIDLTALQTTLAFAVAFDHAGVGAQVVAGQVGDSPIFVCSDETLRPALSHPERDEPILTTSTHDALSARPEQLRTATIQLAPGERLLACTDGVGNFLWSSAGTLDLGRQLLTSMRGPVPQLEFIRQASFDLRSADDDRTLVVLWTRPPFIEPVA